MRVQLCASLVKKQVKIVCEWLVVMREVAARKRTKKIAKQDLDVNGRKILTTVSVIIIIITLETESL